MNIAVCGGTAKAVEKVKPDPLNLSVNTGAGKRKSVLLRRFPYLESAFFVGGILLNYHVLSIAGSDCSGGAGIQADLKTFSALGTYGMSVVTAVVAENTSRVLSVQEVPAQLVGEQIDAIFEDIRVDAVKIGMMYSPSIMSMVARKMKEYQMKNIVVDPVMLATGGGTLMQPEAVEILKEEIIPLSTLLTPNIPEAEVITGKQINNLEERKCAAGHILRMGAQWVLMKGGHAAGTADDLLCHGKTSMLFSSERIPTIHTHGTGCTLSSAITAGLARGMPVEEAVRVAKNYVTEAIRHAFPIGKGRGPLHHFYQWEENNENV